ncbi:hypothetical protein [Haloferula rosea]|uniref:Uncharacterized protein n=1 Tax=Haloferula rosea TaxID=490093 RepID=A0A934RB49_9BACT|nr:hypothetical protein [Haloferula rosea]MBK1827393.1 hypothetical protein [Haloferula rosea]
MKTILLLLITAMVGTATGEPPKQLMLGRYKPLWEDSPFTSKPIVTGPAPVANPLEDYSLGGITKLADGYFAILFNKKDPKIKEVVSPGSSSEFSIVKVDWAENWKETVVTLRKGSTTGTVTFEDKLITIKAPVAQKKAPTNAAARPPIPTKPSSGSTRTPRPRVVTPPKR